MFARMVGRFGAGHTLAARHGAAARGGRTAGPSAVRSAAARCVVENLEGRTLWSATGIDLDPAPGGGAGGTVTAPVTQVTPKVLKSTPADKATGVALDAAITAEVLIPNGGIDASTLTSKSVRLVRESDGYGIPAVLNTSGGGDVIVLKPKSALEPRTKYTFVVSAGLKDVTGAAFAEAKRSFTTGNLPAGKTLPAVKFDQVSLEKTAGKEYLGLAVGPDHRLYASTSDGLIYRFPINPDGTVGDPTVVTTIRDRNGGEGRFVVGMAFDPASTPDAVIVWVSHTAASSLEVGGAAGADWTGKISQLSGPDLGTYRDAVTHLPRSVRDHVTNQPVFGPDGALYFSQPSNTAMGAADAPWGRRPERLLTATVLRLDLGKLGEGTLDAHTEDADPYDPFAAGAPLTIYAYGLRNAFDLAWAADGKLYAAANGSAAGGSTPAGNGAPAIPQVGEAETDYLFRVEKGKYYGHPNPLHKTFVLNGGNPTAGVDPYEVGEYPVGTMPEANWQRAYLDLGPHQAPVGTLQYHGDAFGGALKGKLLIARYSGGDDVVAVDVTGAKPVQYARMAGLTNLNNPSDLVEDRATGFLYVAELGTRKIRLLRPAGTVIAQPPPVQEPPVDETPAGGGQSGGGSAGGGTDAPGKPTDGGQVGGGQNGGGQSGGGQSGGGTADDVPPPAQPGIPFGQRTRSERSLMRKIQRLAEKNSLPQPNLDVIAGADLKAAYAAVKTEAKRQGLVKKVLAVAAKKHVAPPAGFELLTCEQLKALAAQIKRG